MAGEIPDLHVQERTGTGKGAARAVRREHMVPGIVFGGDVDPLPVKMPFNVLLKKLKDGRFKSTLFNLKVDGHEDVRVICRDVQRDIVKDLPTHFDLMRLRRNTKINLFIPVEFVGEEEAPGIRRGGVLTVIRGEIELIVTAGDIPEKVTVDLSALDIGDTVTISQVDLPAGTKPTIDRDFVICNVSAPSALQAEEDEEEAEADEVPTVGDEEGGEDAAEGAEE
ncbi:50S ribosomal protein L25/general stress protein Ctc [Roseovarius indicus]|uniref:Large ribosomal subunit protein bL25 n=1 Tax=Roseovarius indicus TaxID=540747 RepID=A0A0T5P5X4_9RHOB|nr:50S ribosomal protein L25/general stress protein Ctc [Roseovarius indicus]KRS16681.1 50S ribosomal protein L25 [Roseovarius indicus]OAN99968.1 50S ribosomal protein L25/general stress protein Ctc [Roseovarius indicus]QEW28279.1 General stress protein CTC [Roseovarius indicus]SFE13689.1 large subunit ribosomal protein L25 [Roseovarius indicus]